MTTKFIKQVVFVILSLLWGFCAIELIAQPVAFYEYDDYDHVVTDITFNEEGLLFVAKQDGTVFLEGDTLTTFPCWNLQEMGLVGLTYYEGDLFAHVSGYDSVQRVIKYDVFTADLDTIIEVKYKEPFSKIHRGGDIFVQDSFLYCSFGYGSYKPVAQDLTDFRGKLLKINLNTGVIDIVLFGLRNPYRFDFSPALNAGYVADVGEKLYEEVNYFTGDYSLLNLGWPCFEGDSQLLIPDTLCTGFAYSFPEYQYPYKQGGTAIIGGAYWDYNWYFCDHYSGIGGYMDILLQYHKMPIPEGDTLPLKFPKNITGMAVNPYTNELFLCAWGGLIYVAKPLATEVSEPLHDWEGENTLLELPEEYLEDIYIDVLGRIVSPPFPPGSYWNLQTKKRIVVLDR